MIDGEIYTLCNCNLCTFAFRCATDAIRNTHYIGVNKYDEVKRFRDGNSTGYMGEGDTRLATDEEIARFKRLLKEEDYYYNKANKKVIRISTGELL